MSGRSPSGVASLRARFEQNANSESTTPTRGRSPAGSVTSDTSRPISKVRTSFISVGEPSGQMSNLAEEGDVGAPIVGDGAQFSKGPEQSKLNGAGPTSAPKDSIIELLKVKEGQADADAGKKLSGEPGDATSSKPSSSKAEDGSADLGSILKGSAFEKEETRKANASQKPAPAGANKTTGKAAAPPKTSTTPAITKPVEKPIEKPAEKSIEKEKVTNGKPKDSKAMETKPLPKAQPEQPAPTKTQAAPKPDPVAAKVIEPKPQPKAPFEQPAPSKTQTAPKPEPVVAAKAAVKEVEKKDTPAPSKTQTAPKPEPAAAAKAAVKEVEKKDTPAPPAPAAAPLAAPPAQAVAPSPATAPSAAAPPAAAITKEKASKPTGAPSTQTASKIPPMVKREASPEKKQPGPSRDVPKASVAVTAKPPATRTEPKNDGPSASSKPATAKSAASATATSSKAPQKSTSSQKPPPTSGVGFTKPKPRSPTRPVKLPAHLLAQTAASAAKHGDESHTEPHKDTPTAGIKPSSSKAPVHPAPPQRKQPRMSMPATSSSKPQEKEKAKPRMSVAGGSTAGGSFLERMMRPTQSSAQKTHERLDPAKNSPPRKLSGSRNVSGAGPKTVTGASTHKPDEHAHNDGGHGLGREKHGGLTKSEVEHGEPEDVDVPKDKPAAAPESNILGTEGQKASTPGFAGNVPKDA